MKNWFRLFATIALFTAASPAFAQSHSAQFSWTASPTPGIAGYNVYCAPTAGGTFIKVNSAIITGLTFSYPLNAGQAFVCKATAVCPAVAAGCGNGITGESDFSGTAAGTAPTDRPQPPGNFSLVQIVKNIGKAIIYAITFGRINLFG